MKFFVFSLSLLFCSGYPSVANGEESSPRGFHSNFTGSGQSKFRERQAVLKQYKEAHELQAGLKAKFENKQKELKELESKGIDPKKALFENTFGFESKSEVTCLLKYTDRVTGLSEYYELPLILDVAKTELLWGKEMSASLAIRNMGAINSLNYYYPNARILTTFRHLVHDGNDDSNRPARFILDADGSPITLKQNYSSATEIDSKMMIYLIKEDPTNPLNNEYLISGIGKFPSNSTDINYFCYGDDKKSEAK